jgi:hypothetical protein
MSNAIHGRPPLEFLCAPPLVTFFLVVIALFVVALRRCVGLAIHAFIGGTFIAHGAFIRGAFIHRAFTVASGVIVGACIVASSVLGDTCIDRAFIVEAP